MHGPTPCNMLHNVATVMAPQDASCIEACQCTSPPASGAAVQCLALYHVQMLTNVTTAWIPQSSLPGSPLDAAGQTTVDSSKPTVHKHTAGLLDHREGVVGDAALQQLLGSWAGRLEGLPQLELAEAPRRRPTCWGARPDGLAPDAPAVHAAISRQAGLQNHWKAGRRG
jgi:hypothetical protein